MKIVLMEPLGVAPEIIERLADKLRDDGHTFTAYDSFTTDTDELIRRADDADILIIANHPLPGQVIQADKNLKFISVAFVGIDHVDTDACKEKNVGISNTGGYCDDAVAELAVGLTLDCRRARKRHTCRQRACRTYGGYHRYRCDRLQDRRNLQSFPLPRNRLQQKCQTAREGARH